MQNNNITNLLGLKDVIFNNFDEDNEFIYLKGVVARMSICPHCGSRSIRIHDYRVHKIKDTHLRGKKCIIHLKKTRYNCMSCGHRFERKLDFVGKGHSMTKRLVMAIANELREIYSISSIAKRYNVSSNTVLRILSYLSVERSKLPEVLCIDTHRAQVNLRETLGIINTRLPFLMV